MEDLPPGRIAALMHAFAVKDLPLGRTLMMMMMMMMFQYYIYHCLDFRCLTHIVFVEHLWVIKTTQIKIKFSERLNYCQDIIT